MNVWLVLILTFTLCLARGDGVEKISLPLIADIQRADLYVLKLADHPTALLVLCPGCNGNGEDWINNPIWQKFARDNNLDLAGISFASDVSLLQSGRGYYYAQKGSGQLLLDGIRQTYSEEIPLILYGFSGGAHFTAGFCEWRPERVLAWCSYSAAWWDKPAPNEHCPPGLVACGENDPRLWASLIYFKQGRALGKPWLWLCAPKTGHSIYPPAEDFIREYFSAIVKRVGDDRDGSWVDIDHKSEADQQLRTEEPTSVGWLPSPTLIPSWKEIDQP